MPYKRFLKIYKLVRHYLTVFTEAESRYIMAIYDSYNRGVCEFGPKYIANIMNVKRPTAYEMLNRLKNKGILAKCGKKYKFTEEGLSMARKIIRTHRIIETMLYRAGVELERACSVASRIQMGVDEDVVDTLCHYLGDPKRCPHGRPIPEVDK